MVGVWNMKTYNNIIYVINDKKEIRHCANSIQFEKLKEQGFTYLKQNTPEYKQYKKELYDKKQKFGQKMKDNNLWHTRGYKTQKETDSVIRSFERLLNEQYSKHSEGNPRIKKTRKEGI